MGAGKQVVKPPQRGIFPLDHFRECSSDDYVECLKENNDVHHKCRELSKAYLKCRMERQLMASEDLGQLGYNEEQLVRGATEYDNAKEKKGFVAGKHIDKSYSKWWFQR